VTRWTKDDNRGGDPQPGFYELRLVKRGPYLPTEIRLLPDGQWQAIINGKTYPPDSDPIIAQGVYRIWHGGVRSTPERCSFLIALKAWAVTHEPLHPLLFPTSPIDVECLPPLIP